MKQSTQNNFIDGELGRISFEVKRQNNIIRGFSEVWVQQRVCGG